MDIPLHPGLVHWPFAFLTLSYALDVLQPIYTSLPLSVTAHLPPQTDLARISYWSLSLGVLTALPAVASGVAQAVQIVAKQGLYEADKKTIKPKFKALVAHAAASDVVVGVSAWLWWNRDAAGAAVGKGDVGSVVTAVLLGIGLVFAAHLGGKLTYGHGFGLSVSKKAKGL